MRLESVLEAGKPLEIMTNANQPLEQVDIDSG